MEKHHTEKILGFCFKVNKYVYMCNSLHRVSIEIVQQVRQMLCVLLTEVDPSTQSNPGTSYGPLSPIRSDP